MNKRKKAILFLILANIIWGGAFPIYKWALEKIDPFTFAFIRFFLAALIILPFTYKDLKIAKKDIPLLILISIISITLQISFLFFGLTLSPSINAPIIISSGPIVLIFASSIFLKDRIKMKFVLGAIISLLGVLVIMFKPSVSMQKDVFLGNILLATSMLCGVAQAVVLKKIMGDYKALPIVFWSFVIGGIPFLIPIFLFEKNFLSYPFFDLQILAGILYATLLSSVVGYYFLYYGIKYIKASEIGIFSYVDPIATILIAIPLLSEKITPLYLIGTFLVFFGIFIAEERINYHPLGKLFENANSKDLYNLNQI